MPEEKLKSENYTNFGGVDRKSSPYITPKNSFLTIENQDFNKLGALSTTPGTTQYSVGSATTAITGLGDYYTTNSTYGYGGVSYTLLATTYNDLCDVTGSTFPSLLHFVYGNNPTPFSILRNQYAFGCNGWDFYRYQGSTQGFLHSLPPPIMATLSFTGTTAPFTNGIAIFATTSIWFAYLRNDGMIGPASVGYSALAPDAFYGWTAMTFQLPRFNTNVGVGAGISFGSFGISGVLYWFERLSDNTFFMGITTPFSGLGYSAAISGMTYLIIPPTTTSLTVNAYDFSVVLNPFVNLGIDPEQYIGTYYYGFSQQTTVPNYSGITGSIPQLPLVSRQNNPQTIEAYNNQLFAGGFFYSPDAVWYSRIGELEKQDFENFFLVRANDGDIVSCIISYFTQLVIFKINSTHALTGTDPDNFVLTEVTDDYGCLSPRAACTWEQNLWFLDKKGIAVFNGANTKVISNSMENYFLRMNVPAARVQAIMIHVKERNEIWTAIPIDGATLNNIIIVYDYLADAWRTRTISQGTALTTLTKGIDKPVTYNGNFSGIISAYGSSYFTDNGVAFTSIIKSRFLSDLGHSVEKQFRRLFLDVAVPAGQTYIFPINFYTDQGVSPALQTTMVLSSFQNRLEFGLPAKDMSFEMFYSGGQYLQLNGFTIEYRFQRAV